MRRIIICNFTKDKGRFLFWTWELWSAGGGGGVSWFFLGRLITIRRFNPLWAVFKIQRKLKTKTLKFPVLLGSEKTYIKVTQETTAVELADKLEKIGTRRTRNDK